MWKNGVLIFEDTTSKTLNSSTDVINNAIFMSYWNGGCPKEQTLYIDDVTVTSDTPANQDAQGNRMIGPTDWGAADITPPITTATPNGTRSATAQSITLSANETATIYYTVDGTEPTESSAQYSSPLTIKPGKTLWAFAKDAAGNVGTKIKITYGWPKTCR
jgi:LysM repeat protein